MLSPLFKMKIAFDKQNIVGEGSISKKGKEVCRNGSETSNPWPYRIKLTTDSMRWDSLKISPSREFNNLILENLSEDNCKALDMWKPIEVSIYDVDTQETYKVSLAKKEAFWFEPFPDVGQRKVKSASSNTTLEHYIYEFEQRRKEFSYSLQPFRHIIKKKSLRYDQEIGFCWSGNATVDRIDFSVLYSPKFASAQLKILREQIREIEVKKWTQRTVTTTKRIYLALRVTQIHAPYALLLSFKNPISTLVSTENFSIIYGYDGSSFQRHYVNQGFEDRNDRMNQRKTLGMKQEEFKALVSNAARPFLTAKTDRFVNELELFLASGLNIEAYDEVYMQRLGWNSHKTSEASGESIEHSPVVPYLYIFDADSDESD
ncbi:unnamed protein product [Dovyalis caffra]|uniref:Uncharacterized protein n=1 Tax=Dovyalis caffra TaxID=77055 RepID=A0AAV1RXH8_9ROSI|nr:unnamed protein product [Dovyalis caffra]